MISYKFKFIILVFFLILVNFILISKTLVASEIYGKNQEFLIDYREIGIPYFSTQIFEIIIEIVSAEHLDSNRNFISDIYESVKELDDIWSPEISNREYVRVVFEKPLTEENDITIYPRIVSGNPRVEVYEINSDEKIAEFFEIKSNEYNKIYLTNLISESQDSFDLRVVDGSLEFDYILDPYSRQSEGFTSSTIWTVPSGITEITVEAWGAGGAGGGASGGGERAGGGGGGGAYALRNITVSPGQEFTLTVAGTASGVLGGNGNAGGSSSLSNATATYVLASGGSGGTSGGGAGAGGTAASSTGDVTYSGGSGSASGTGSGAGGGGAGSTGAGGSASGTTAGTGTTELGGTGGGGLTGTGNGNSGFSYGGAGGGARKTGAPSSVTGGSGAPGYIRISYDEFIPIEINVLSPLNETYRSSTVWFNATANDVMDTWIVNFNGTNITLSNINTTLEVNAGIYDLIIYANDSCGRWGVNDSITFTVDLTPPEINVLSPEQDKYYGNSLIWFNITTNIWSVANYTLDGGLTNYTLTANGTNTGFSASRSVSDGEQTVRFYAQDEYGNLNDSVVVDFEVDTTFPEIDFVDDVNGITGTALNNSNFSRNWIFVNVSVNETNEVNITFNLYDSLGGLINSTTYTSPVRTINWTGLSDGFYYYNVSVQDIVGNTNFTETRNLRLDTIGPVITIVKPKPILYNINTSLPLNYTVYDEGIETLSQCWWNLNNGENNSITCGENTTFDIVEEGTNTIYVFSNDTLGNLNYESVTFEVDTNIPSIALNTPENNDFLNYTSINFSYTPTDERGIDTCVLYGNWGGWSEKQFDSEIEEDVLNYFLDVDLNSYGDGEYFWNVWCNNSVGSSSFAISNYTFFIDTTFPEIDFVDDVNGITGTALNNSNFSRNWIFVNVSVNETNEVNITFNLYDSLGGLINSTTHTSPIRTINWTGLSDGFYYYNVSVYDFVNNFNYTETRNIRLDTIGPVISITRPENIIYSSSVGLLLNYTVYDEGIETLSQCWWNLNNGENNSITCGENTTFDASEGNNRLNFYSNDSLGNLNNESVDFIVDLTSPNWTQQNQTRNNVYVDRFYPDQELNLSVVWNDNFELSTAWLSTNESGEWENKITYNSPQEISGTIDISDFIWQNNSLDVGNIVSWKIYANDSVGRENFTDEMSFRIWGYSEISEAFFSPAGVKVGFNSTFYCKVSNNYSQQEISNYNVSFYEEGVYLGSNLTDSNGYSQFLISGNDEAGTRSITCNITSDESKYYSVSLDNEETVNLGIGYLESIYYFTTSIEDSWVFEGMTQFSTTAVPSYKYDLLTYNDNDYLTYAAPDEGEYSYQRFEIKIDEDLNELSYLEINWTGRGTTDGAASTAGYVVYFWNFTSSSWVQLTSYSGGTAKGSHSFNYTDDFSNLVNSTGYVYVLARSYESRATGGGPGTRGRTIETDYVHIRTFSDIISPKINLNYPDELKTNNITIEFSCYVQDDYKIKNVTLYGNWSGSWEENETNSSGINEVNYTFSKTINEQGSFIWNCYACDFAGNCGFSGFNNQFSIDTISPNINFIYPINNQNFSNFEIPSFNYSVLDLSFISNCSLYGNFNGTWLKNQTVNSPEREIINNFSEVNVINDGYYIWNVYCYDEYGNLGWNSTNFTFAAFYPPYSSPNLINITQDLNNGFGENTFSWEEVSNAEEYWIYYLDNLNNEPVFLNKTTELNYTDTSFSGNKRRFYQIQAWNPSGENSSLNYFGAHVYTLRHNGKTINWLGFPTNLSYLENANQTLNEIPNATGVTMFNNSIQKKVTCNSFSCPDSFSCTETNCNFKFETNKGGGYEIGVDSSAPDEFNWSGVGIVNKPLEFNLIKNSTSYGKNWISMTAFTNLSNAGNLIQNISNADAVSRWNSELQKSEGGPKLPGWGFMGNNFDISLEESYEVSVTANELWRQA